MELKFGWCLGMQDLADTILTKKRVAKAFFNVKDAEAFKESLEKAQKLLQYTENIDIKIEVQS